MARIAAYGACAALIALASGARADEPNPSMDGLFTAAQKFLPDQPLRALDAYQAVAKDRNRSNPEQAEALLRAGLLGYQYAYQALPGDLSGTARAERQKAQEDTALHAHDAVKQLLEHYADTPAGAAAAQARYGPRNDRDLQAALEQFIDGRNSLTISYKIVDFLVKMTGSRPAFSYWFALFLIALSTRVLTFPLTLKTYKSQREMQRMQPIVKAIQERYKGDQAEMNRQMMAAYKEHGVNPFGACLPTLVSLPFLWWVWYVIRAYQFHFINGRFLWIGGALSHRFPAILATSLGQFDWVLLGLYAVSNFIMTLLTPAQDPQMAQQQKTMAVVTTVMMTWFFLNWKWPAAFFLYWLFSNLFTIWQQYVYVYKPNRAIVAAGGGPAIAAAGTGGAARVTPTTPIPNSSPRPRPRGRKVR